MKLSELEDFDKLQNAFDRLENKLDSLFNQLEARINRLERTIWLAITASIAQIITALALLAHYK
jgi:ubiquinone biosynthesis protein UbiJ